VFSDAVLFAHLHGVSHPGAFWCFLSRLPDSACFLLPCCFCPPVPLCCCLQEQTISDKFAGLSEALQIAESKAREATEMRKHVALEMARRQKQAKDEQLRKLAQQARMERGGPLAAAAAAGAGGGSGGGLASRLDAGGAAAGAAAGEMPRYPGPPGGGGGGGGGGGYRGDDSPGSSEDEERRRGSRRREEGGRGRERDEYQETAQVRPADGRGEAGMRCMIAAV
jgi:hypothetical protein